MAITLIQTEESKLRNKLEYAIKCEKRWVRSLQHGIRSTKKHAAGKTSEIAASYLASIPGWEAQIVETKARIADLKRQLAEVGA